MLLLALRRWLRVVVVEGSSMAPTYRDGDRVLAVYGARVPLPLGAVVVAQAPDPTWTAAAPIEDAQVRVIKRITAVAGQPRPDGAGRVPPRAVYLTGDAGGYDSTTFGAVPRTAVLGRVVAVLTRAGARDDGSER